MKLLKKGMGARAAAATAIFSAAIAVLGVSSASAIGTKTGPATILDGSGARPITSGGSHTPFQVGLPPQAKCPGDTATNHYNVYGFIVAAPTDPGTLTYDSANGPNNNPQAFPLVDTFGSPYNAANVAPNTGQIYPSGPPTFDFAVFDTTQLVPGTTYSLGIACVKSDGPTPGATVTYFSTQITINASATDPNGFTFAVVPASNIPESPLAVALPLSALAVLGFGGYMVYRRRRTSATAA